MIMIVILLMILLVIRLIIQVILIMLMIMITILVMIMIILILIMMIMIIIQMINARLRFVRALVVRAFLCRCAQPQMGLGVHSYIDGQQPMLGTADSARTESAAAPTSKKHKQLTYTNGRQ